MPTDTAFTRTDRSFAERRASPSEDVPFERSAAAPEQSTSAPPETPNPSASATGLADSPSDHDDIGFAPYVRAVARFLCDRNTKPPLTMSVEGRWGSGKSSFLLQLAKQIRDLQAGPPPSKVYTIWFNAWRSDNEEALWAAFALIFIKQLSRQIPLARRLKANLMLLFYRFDFNQSKFQLLQLLLFLAALFFFITLGILEPEKIHQSLANMGAASFSAAALLGWGYERAKKLFGNPLSRDLARYVRNPRYEERLSFIDRFQEDFAKVLQSYVGSRRVFVFIDDLDRCEVPKAAELMQAINLLISADQPAPDTTGALRKAEANLFFIMGLDRKVVAAGIAAKNEKVLPYIASIRLPADAGLGDLHRAGLDYGYEFLEKFIQVPFRVPEIGAQHNRSWISALTQAVDDDGAQPAMSGGTQAPQPGPPSPPATPPVFEVGPDPEQFGEVVARVTAALQFNPRRVKQFINMFRLQVLILIETGVLRPAAASPGAPGTSPLTLEEIGLVIGIFSRWPGIIPDLLEHPTLFDDLWWILTGTKKQSYPALEFWLTEQPLVELLRMGEPYQLSRQAVRRVLDLVPVSDRGGVKWGHGVGRRTRLIGSGDDMANNPNPSPGGGNAAPAESSVLPGDPTTNLA